MKNQEHTKRLAVMGLMAALCFVGYAVFPALNAGGTKIHFGNCFVVIAAYLLGGVPGGLAGAVGLGLADVLCGFAASAPRTFICKFMIGLIAGTVAHKAGHITEPGREASVILRWTIIAAVAGLAFNCVFEPCLKYVWYTILIPDSDKAASAIKALMALNTYATFINAITNSIAAVILYNALRPVLAKSGMLFRIGKTADSAN